MAEEEQSRRLAKEEATARRLARAAEAKAREEKRRLAVRQFEHFVPGISVGAICEIATALASEAIEPPGK